MVQSQQAHPPSVTVVSDISEHETTVNPAFETQKQRKASVDLTSMDEKHNHTMNDNEKLSKLLDLETGTYKTTSGPNHNHKSSTIPQHRYSSLKLLTLLLFLTASIPITMHLSQYLAATLLSLPCITSAFPATTSTQPQIQAGLRLIKTSESDPGTWVSDDDKIIKYVNKGVHFIDITDIKDPEVLSRLSTKPGQQSSVNAAQVTYPSSVSHQSEANALIANVGTSSPQSWLKSLTNFYNRYYKSSYGTESGTWLFNTVKSVASANSAITVSQFSHSYNQPSIIARIPGSSSNIVVVGAHYDSTGGSPTARGPGADDNGSGVIVVLEALRVLVASGYKPKNTLEFHFYSGEEGGLLGSSDVWANYKSTGKKVIAFVNQDMAGYSPSGKISIYNDYSDSGLNAYTKKIINAYGGGSYTTDTCGYGCSDHASAYNNGFPAVYVCDEPDKTSTPYIHSPNDSYETVQWPTVLRHAKFTVGFLVEASYI